MHPLSCPFEFRVELALPFQISLVTAVILGIGGVDIGNWDGGSGASVFVLKWLDWVRATPLSNRDLQHLLKGEDISGR